MATNFVSCLPKARNNIHSIQYPKQLVTGDKMYMPICQLGQYGQAILGDDSNTKKERSRDCLYIGPKNNASGHWAFNLNTKQRINCSRVRQGNN